MIFISVLIPFLLERNLQHTFSFLTCMQHLVFIVRKKLFLSDSLSGSTSDILQRGYPADLTLSFPSLTVLFKYLSPAYLSASDMTISYSFFICQQLFYIFFKFSYFFSVFFAESDFTEVFAATTFLLEEAGVAFVTVFLADFEEGFTD